MSNKNNPEAKGMQSNLMTEKDYSRSRAMAIMEGVSARIVFSFTTGAFLTGFLKYMGADDSLCGIISAIPVLAGVIQFFSPLLLERLSVRKPLLTLLNGMHRLLLFLMVFIPMLSIPIKDRLYLVAVLYFVSFLAVNFSTPAVSALFISLVPQSIRGRYFSLREALIMFFSSILNIIMGSILDSYRAIENEFEGYIIMYGFVLLATLLNILAYIWMKDPRGEDSKKVISLKKLFIMPFQEKPFLKVIILFFIWSISINFSIPFFSVYMVSKLNLSYTFISSCSLMHSISYFISVNFWGHFSDKKSFIITARLSIGLLGITHSLWLFVGNGMDFINPTILLFHIIGGVAWAGINLALFNIPFEYTPEDSRTVYIGFNAAISGLAGFASSMFSAWLVRTMENYEETLFGITITQMQLIFFVSGLLTIITSLYIGIFIKQRSV